MWSCSQRKGLTGGHALSPPRGSPTFPFADAGRGCATLISVNALIDIRAIGLVDPPSLDTGFDLHGSPPVRGEYDG